MTEFIAHVSEDKSRFHLLEDHLIDVADLASAMAAEFGAPKWWHPAGEWHDLGEFFKAFQEWIRAVADLDVHIETKQGWVDDPTAGGIWAVEKMKGPGRVPEHLTASNHVGML